jgi:cytochrome c-type biogenesis protein CcmE
MRKRTQRLIIIGAAGLLLAVATALVLRGFNDSIVFFYGPSEIAAKARPGQYVRLGGLVEAGSVQHSADGVLSFRVTDGAAVAPVSYRGPLPDLFKENQGVVAEGEWLDGRFVAKKILAKHDEQYIPKEVQDTLKERGEWRGGS